MVGDDVVQFPGQLKAFGMPYPLDGGTVAGGEQPEADPERQGDEPEQAAHHRYGRAGAGEDTTRYHDRSRGGHGAGRTDGQRPDRGAGEHRQPQGRGGAGFGGQVDEARDEDGERGHGQTGDGGPQRAAAAHQGERAHPGGDRRPERPVLGTPAAGDLIRLEGHGHREHGAEPGVGRHPEPIGNPHGVQGR